MMIPALDLIDGRIVRLFQGDYEQVTHYPLDPIEQVQKYQDAGAQCIHLVDLSGAKERQNRQCPLIEQIIKSTSAKVQVGGGIRCHQDIENLLFMGASRLVIGSMAVKKPEMLEAWIKDFGPEQLVLALDVHIDQKGQRLVALSGWQENSGLTLEALLERFLDAGLRHVLCTDISKDGTLRGSNVPLYKDLCHQYPQIQWQSSGGVGALSDIQALSKTGVSGVIVGRALLDKKFTLKDALACWQKE